MAQNAKSDKNVKEAFKSFLVRRGYKIEKWDPDENNKEQCPADVFASKNGELYLFEIKKTSKTNNYFGAATYTEWAAALGSFKGRYFFILAFENEGTFQFYKITPEAFMKYSTIPPFKIYFNIPFKIENGKIVFGSLNRDAGPIEMNDNVFEALKCDWQDLSGLKLENGHSYGDENDFEFIGSANVESF